MIICIAIYDDKTALHNRIIKINLFKGLSLPASIER